MILSILVLCLFGLSRGTPEKIPSERWMSFLSGETQLNRISIPGTHDSGARGAPGLRTGTSSLANTQTFTIKEQLQHGVRFFDIRLKINGERMGIYHGPVWYGWLDDALKDFGDFLTANPYEVVFMMYKHEGGVGSTSFKAKFATNFRNHYQNQYGTNQYHDCNDTGTDNDHCQIPKLKDVRGKLILINKEGHGTLGTRYFSSEDNWNLRESDSQYASFGCRRECRKVSWQEWASGGEGWRTDINPCEEICNYYTYMQGLKYHMTSAKTKRAYSLTFCSVNTGFTGFHGITETFVMVDGEGGSVGAGWAPNNPEGWARQVNYRMMDMLRLFPNNQNAELGVVLFDFPSIHLIRSVFMKNYGTNNIFKKCARIGFDGWKITWDLEDGYSRSFGGDDLLNDSLDYVLLENGCKLKVWQDVGFSGASEVLYLRDYSEDGSADRNEYEGWLKNGWDNDVSSIKCWCS